MLAHLLTLRLLLPHLLHPLLLFRRQCGCTILRCGQWAKAGGLGLQVALRQCEDQGIELCCVLGSCNMHCTLH